ncbi:hypothetical protein AG1IA_00772 [Rhizoctonia solani AG-1 IA]|uniref:Uncharacterized protein n=1 Tax=Thanatephorus cucumeris (strain AG1-IA) TaxID=983506 RepID=L8X7X8_THACA|nr:hypothetical protein AG1IA_00772 [Rhizoctonia solani AG-1 IA]
MDTLVTSTRWAEKETKLIRCPNEKISIALILCISHTKIADREHDQCKRINNKNQYPNVKSEVSIHKPSKKIHEHRSDSA